MALACVTTVVELAEARGLCQRGEAHACIVVRDDLNLDQNLDKAPPPTADAPGCGSGVQSMIMVPDVTTYMRKAACRDGYMTV